MLKTIEVSNTTSTRALIVQAIDDNAEAFYKHYGFLETKVDLTLLLPLEDINAPKLNPHHSP